MRWGIILKRRSCAIELREIGFRHHDARVTHCWGVGSIIDILRRHFIIFGGAHRLGRQPGAAWRGAAGPSAGTATASMERQALVVWAEACHLFLRAGMRW